MVQKVLPAIRVELARIMMKEFGLQQQDVARRLGVSKAAVSQYLSSKRGAYTDFSDEVKADIRDLAQMVVSSEDTSQLTEMFCNICRNLQTTGWVYRESGGSPVRENCAFCLNK